MKGVAKEVRGSTGLVWWLVWRPSLSRHNTIAMAKSTSLRKTWSPILGASLESSSRQATWGTDLSTGK